jgi:hypothetical protein
MTIDEYVDAFWPDVEILKADGFDEAFLGIGTQAGNAIAVYDREKCIEILSRDMTREQAVEYFAFNTECAYVGPATPMFLEAIPARLFSHNQQDQ